MNFKDELAKRSKAIDERISTRTRAVERAYAGTKNGKTWTVYKIRTIEGFPDTRQLMFGLSESEALKALARLSKKQKDGITYDIGPTEL